MRTDTTFFNLAIGAVVFSLAGCMPPLDDPADPDPRDSGVDSSADTGDSARDTGDTARDTGDTGEPQGQEPPSAEAFGALSGEARAGLVQTFSVDAGEYSSVEGTQGTTVMFSANSLLDQDGAVVAGDIEIELIELYAKGNMLVADVPSVGRNNSGEMAQLVSGGEHFVSATQDGEALSLADPMFLMAPAENTGGADTEMVLFRGEDPAGAGVGIDDEVVWVEEKQDRDGFGIEGDGDGVGGSYWMLSSEFGWTNIDKWWSDPRPKTTIHVDVPDGWDDENCAVYLSYDGEPTALAQFDTYDSDTELFSEHYGLIPIGLEVHVIFVTELDGDWSYAIQSQTIEENHVTVFASADDFIETDTDGLVDVINALP